MRRDISAATGAISCKNDDLFVFSFNPAGAALLRQGDSLLMRLSDGREILFKDFYRVSRASFVIDDQEIGAKEFFAALGSESLAPAMGPAQSSPQSGSDHSSHHLWETMSALDGIWHLDGLDISFETSREPQDVLHVNPHEPASASPRIPAETPLEAPAVDIADEAAPGSPAIIHIPAGAEVISVACEGPGHAEQLPDGSWAYFPKPIDSGDIPGRNEVEGGDTLTVILKKPDGTTETFRVPVTIRDDVPEARDDAAEGERTVSGNVLENDSFGADGPHEKTPIRWERTEGDYGKLTVDDDGGWTYAVDPGFRLPFGETVTETFRYVIKDRDGDESEACLTITIRGTDHPVSITPDNPAGPETDPGVPDIPADPENPVHVPLDAKISTVTVSEKDLEKGDVSVRDSFSVNAPDGAAEIGIGGVVVWKDGELTGKEVATGEGRLIVISFNPETGCLEYEFRLERATQEHGEPGEDRISHTFEVKVTDLDGSEGKSFIRVVISDDTPQAESDLANTGETGHVSGNVLDNDSFGADGPAEKPVEWLDAEPKYGKITLRSDGSWEYEINPELPALRELTEGESLIEEFRYKIIDADGDESEAVLVIRIDGKDDGVTVTPVDPVIPDPETPDVPVGEGDPLEPGKAVSQVEVRESGLAAGQVRASGDVDIEAPDGLASISVAGVSVWTKEGGLTGNEVATDEGRLVATGFENGRLAYEFILDRATQEHGKPGSDAISHSFAVSALDRDGSAGFGHISVRIIDDIPRAEDDLATVSEGEMNPVSGNVADNDSFGADGGKFTRWLDDAASKYGKLELNSDGSYSFLLDRKNPDVMRLSEGEFLEERFRYQITDSDGDISEAVLTVRVDGKNHEPSIAPRNPDPEIPADPDRPVDPGDPATQGSGGKISEKDIDPDNPPAVKGGIDISSPDGIERITVKGEDVPTDGTEKEIETPAGRLVVKFIPDPEEPGKGTLEYEYRLERPVDHPEDAFDDFPVNVTDPDGDSSKTLIRIEIIDDKPVARDDSARISEDDSILVSSGSVLANDRFGKDGPAGIDSLVWDNSASGRIEGAYGWLEPAGDGNWTYHLDRNNPDVRRLADGESLEESFGYSIKDHDGDTARAFLRISIDGKNHQPSIVPKEPDPGIPADPDKPVDPTNPETQGSGGMLEEKDINSANPPSVKKAVEVTSPDGIGKLKVLGEDIPTDGTEKTIETPHGKIVVKFIPDPDDIGKGTLEYGYFLEKPASHPDEMLEDIPVEVIDSDGDSAKSLIRIEIVDDKPVACDDFAEISEGEASVSSTPDNMVLGNDAFGADGPAPDGFLRWEGELAGKYGTLKPNADGSWEYVLDGKNPAVMALKEGESLDNEEFSYVIKDADGSEATAALHIKISGRNNGVEITPRPGPEDPDVPPAGENIDPDDVYAPGSGVVVHEKAIGSEDAIRTRTLDISAPDGVKSVAIDGTEIGSEWADLDGRYGEMKARFVIDPDDPRHGSLEYRYTLAKTVNHDSEEPVESFALVVTDTDGSRAASEIRVEIRDDAPTAENDAVSIDEGTVSVKVDILANDDYGRDGAHAESPLVFEKLSGDWGELRQVDGEWRYFLNNSDPAIRGMKDGDTKTDVFHYTIMDKDGSAAEADLAITINGKSGTLTVTPGPEDGSDMAASAFSVRVFEKHLSGGTEKDESLLMKRGHFDIDAEAGVRKVLFGGVVLSGEWQDIPCDLGVLQARLDGDRLEWEYRLDSEKTHSEQGRDELSRKISLVVTDNEGKSAEGSVNIAVEDDIPVFGENSSHGLSGSFELSFGADRAADIPFEGASRTDEGWKLEIPQSDACPGGVLIIHDDFSWEFAPENANLNFDGRIAITAIDRDGDRTPLVLSVSRHEGPTVINEGGDSGHDMNLGQIELDEGANPTHGGESHGPCQKTFGINLHGDDGVIRVGGIEITVKDGQAVYDRNAFCNLNGIDIRVEGVSEDNGIWTINCSFAYGAAEGQSHANGQPLGNELVITVESGGKSATGTFFTELHDDAPIGVDDAKDITEGMASVSGNVLDNDATGADSQSRRVDPVKTQGTYGKFTLNEDGGWIYELDNSLAAVKALKEDGDPLEDSIEYTLYDHDGTPATATLTVSVRGVNHGVIITPKPEPEDPEIPPASDDNSNIDNLHAEGSGADIHEKDAMSAPILVARAISIDAPDGLRSLEISKNGRTVDLIDGIERELTGDYGKITASYDAETGVVTWTYEFSGNIDHSEKDILPDDFLLVAVDQDGSRADSVISPRIHDDAPKAENDTDEISEGAAEPATGNVLANDYRGADSPVTLFWNDGVKDVSDVSGNVIEGLHGFLTLTGDGGWEYRLKDNDPDVMALKEGESLEDVFAYSITDTDGDVSPAKLAITINGADNGVTVTPKNPDPEIPEEPGKTPDPADPSTWGAGEHVSDAVLRDGGSETRTGHFDIDVPDGFGKAFINGAEIPGDGSRVDVRGENGTLTAWLVKDESDLSKARIEYEYLFDKAGRHPAGQDTVEDAFQLLARDTDGSEGKSRLVVKISDDAPEARDDSATITEGSEEALSGTVLYAFGGDGDAAENPLVWLDGEATARYGTVTLNADGSWEYRLDNLNQSVLSLKEDSEPLTETFRYRVTDADGDEAEATLTITITGTDGKPKVTPGDPDPEIPGDGDKEIDPADRATQGAKLEFSDKNLANGSDPRPGELAKSGHFDVNAPDGAKSVEIEIGDQKLTLAALKEDGSYALSDGEITVKSGDVSVGVMKFSYEPDGILGGQVKYEFTLENPAAHGLDDDFSARFSLVVTELDGDVAKSAVVLKINDDEPSVAGSQERTVTEGDSENATVSGDALELFATGADTHPEKADGFAWIVSQETLDEISRYGELSLNPDGQWTFRLDSGLPATKKLLESDLKEFELSCRYTDADGDPVESFVTLKIQGVNNGITLTPEDPNLPSDPDPETPPENPYVPESGDDPDRPKDRDPNPDDPYDPADPNWGRDLDGNAIARVFESGLEPDGTETGSRNVKAHGAIDVNAPDGVASLTATLNGETGNIMAGCGFDVKDDGVVIGRVGLSWNAAESRIEYNFVLSGTAAHSQQGFDSWKDSVKIHAVSESGEDADISLILQVIDDRPLANPDTGYSVSEKSATIDGDALANDFYGADGRAAADFIVWKNAENGEIQGKYGKLVLNGEGSWTYQLDPDNPETLKLKNGQVEHEEFFYVIKDSDGDTAQASLVIDVHGASGGITVTPHDPDPEVPGDPGGLESHGASAKLHEADLPDGTNAEKGALVKTDYIEISANDGVAGISLGGHAVDMDGEWHGIPVENGKLSVRYEGDIHGGKLHYRFEIDGPSHHDRESHDEWLGEDLRLVVADYEEQTRETTLRLGIEDDIPMFGEAIPDGNPEFSAVHIHKASTTTSAIFHGGEYGSIYLDGQEVLKVTYQDGREFGDRPTDENGYTLFDVEILVNHLEFDDDNGNHVILNVTGWERKDLSTTSAKFTLKLEYEVSHDGTSEENARVLVGIRDCYTPGQEVPNGDYVEGYQPLYVTDKNIVKEANGSLSGSFALSFGADGMNDVPFRVDSDIEPSLATESRWEFGLEKTGSHPAGKFVIEKTESGYSYNFEPADPNLNFNGSTIKISAIDADDDVAEKTVTVSRHLPVSITDKSGGELKAGANASEFILDEGDQPQHAGDAHGPGQGGFTVNLHGQDGVIEVEGIRIEIRDGKAVSGIGESLNINGAELTVESAELNAGGRWDISCSYRYADENGQTHPEESDSVSGRLNIAVTGFDGQKATGTITAIIHDDAPVAEADAGAITEGDTSVDGNVLSNDSFGKDGQASESHIRWEGLYENGAVSAEPEANEAGDLVIQGRYGHFVVKADGSYEYFLNNDSGDVIRLKGADGENAAESLAEQVKYVITDGDGSQAEEYLTITITGKSGDITITPENSDPDVPGMPGDSESHGAGETLYEKNRADGNEPDGDSLSKEGRVEIRAADGVKAVSLGGESVELDGEWHEMATQYGKLEVRYEGDIRGGWLEYRYSLDGVETHPDQGVDSLSETLTLAVTDYEDKTNSSSLKLTVVDDVPVFGKEGKYLPAGEYTIQFTFENAAEIDGFWDGGSWHFTVYDENGEKDEISYTENDLPTPWYDLTHVSLYNDSGERIFYDYYPNNSGFAEFKHDVWLKISQYMQGRIPCDWEGDWLAVSFGADGMADIPFTLEDGMAPVSIDSENNAYGFEIRDHETFPNGHFTIEKDGSDWKYSFMSENDNLNYDFDLKLNAIDGDGDVTTKILHLQKTSLPTFNSGDIDVDEGTQPYHDWYEHDNFGTRTLEVNLHGDDGTIVFGNMVIKIKDGVLTNDKSEFTTEDGIIIKLGAYEYDNGVWNISYGYSYTGKIHDHPHINYKYDFIRSDIPVTITSSNGESVSGVINGFIHDDIPIINDILPETDEMGVSLNGSALLSFGADGAGNIPASLDSKYLAEGDIDSWIFRITEHKKLPNGTLSFTRNGDHYDYSFTPDDSAAYFDEVQLSLQITDGDGDWTYAMLKFANPAPVPVATGESIELSLHDADTVSGSASDTGLVHAFNRLSGNAELTFAGVENITVEGLPDGDGYTWRAKGNVLTGRSESGHVITITAEVENGDIRFTTRMDDPALQAGNSLKISGVSITATQAGKSATADCLSVTVSDTGVSTESDHYEISSDHADALSFNVVDNDTPGADGYTVVWNEAEESLKGRWGTFERADDGGWTYKLDTQNEEVMELGKDQNLVEEFHYTLRDADGDESDNVLTITINGREGGFSFTPGDGTEQLSGGQLVTTVYEKYLEEGTSPDSDQLIQSGSVVIHADHGIKELTGLKIVKPAWALNDMPDLANFPAGQTPVEIESEFGVWSLVKTRLDAQNWRLDWTFELTGTAAHKGAASGANYIDSIFREFQIQVEDNGGQTATQTIRVSVIDDVPQGHTYTYDIYDYELVFDPGENVLSKVLFGADGAHANPNPFNKTNSGNLTLGGYAGSLHVETDGSWYYDMWNHQKVGNLAYGEVYKERGWDYIVRDEEGDTAPGRIEINIIGSGRPKFLGNPAAIDVFEGGLPDGQSGGETAGTMSFDIRADYSGEQNTYLSIRGQDAGGNDAVITLTIPPNAANAEFPAGTELWVNHVKLTNFRAGFVGGKFGTDWTISCDYALQDAQTHFQGMTDEQIGKALDISITNDKGVSQDISGSVTVHDDTPMISIDENVGYEQQGSFTHVNGHVEMGFGADNGDGRQLSMVFDRAGVIPVTANGELQADGHTWIFDFGDMKFSLDERTGDWKTLESHRPLYGEYVIRFKITDSDGDVAEAQTNVSIDTGVEIFYDFFQEAGRVGHNISQETGKTLGVENIANWVISDNANRVFEGEGQFADNGAITLTGSYANHTWSNCGTDEKVQSQVDIPLGVTVSETPTAWYVAPAENGQVALVAAAPADGRYYGTLTLSRVGNGLKYSFDLNEDSGLVNEMVEGEKISLYFTIRQETGQTKILNFDIRGSNDEATASFDKIQNEVQAGLCNQDKYYNQAYFGYYDDRDAFSDGNVMNIKDGPDGTNLENSFLHPLSQLGIYQIGNFADPDSDGFNADGSFNGQLSIKKYAFDSSWTGKWTQAPADSEMDRFDVYSKNDVSEYTNFYRVKWTLGNLESFRQYREMLGDDYVISDGTGLLPTGEYIRFDMYYASSNNTRSWPEHNAASAYVDVNGKIYTNVTISFQSKLYLDVEIFDAHGTSTEIPFEHVAHAAHKAPSFAEFTDIFTVAESALKDTTIGQAELKYVYGVPRNEKPGSVYYIADENGDLVTELRGQFGTLKIDPGTGAMTFTPDHDAPLKRYDPDADPAAMEGIDRHTDHFTLVLKDKLGAVDTKEITVVIKGVNNAPDIERHLPSHITEEAGAYPVNTPDSGKSVVNGHISASDIDKKSSFNYIYSIGGQKGHELDGPVDGFTHAIDNAYGKFYYNNTGDWEFRLDNSLPAVDSLPRGEHRHFTVSVKVTDEFGASSKTQSFYIFVVGENDRPVLDMDASRLMGEIQGTQVVGQVLGTDVDAGETEKLVYMFSNGGSLTQSVQTGIGTLVMRSPESGEFVFLLDMHSELVQRAYALMLPRWEEGMEVLPFSATGLDWQQFVADFCQEKGIDLSSLATVRGTDPFGAYFETAVGIRDIPPIQLIPEEIKPVPVGLSWLQIELDEYDVYGKDAEKHYSDSRDIDIAQIVMAPGEAPIDYQEGILSNIAWAFVKTDGSAPASGYVTHVGLGQINGSFQSIATKYGVLEIDHETGALRFTLDVNNPELQALMQGGNSQKLHLSDILSDLNGYGILAYHTDMYSQNSVTWFTDDIFGDGDPLLWIHDVNISPEVVTPMPVIFIQQDETKSGHTDIADPDSAKSGMDYEVYIDGARQKVVVNENGFVCKSMYGTFTFDRMTGNWNFEANGDASRALALGENQLISMHIDVLDQKTGTKQNSTDLSFLIDGVNDAPVALNEQVIELEDRVWKDKTIYGQTWSKCKDENMYIQTGQILAYDPDVTDKLTFELLNISTQEYGIFTLDEDGTYTFISNGKAIKDENIIAKIKITDNYGEYIITDYQFILNGIDNDIEAYQVWLYYSNTAFNSIQEINNYDTLQYYLTKHESWTNSIISNKSTDFDINRIAVEHSLILRDPENTNSLTLESIKFIDENNNIFTSSCDNDNVYIEFENFIIYFRLNETPLGSDFEFSFKNMEIKVVNTGINIETSKSNELLANGKVVFDFSTENGHTEIDLNLRILNGFVKEGKVINSYKTEGVNNIPETVINSKNIFISTIDDLDDFDGFAGFNNYPHTPKKPLIDSVTFNDNVVNLQENNDGSISCYLAVSESDGIKIVNIGTISSSFFNEAISQGVSYLYARNFYISFEVNENYNFLESDILSIQTTNIYYDHSIYETSPRTRTISQTIIFHPGAPELNGTDDPDLASAIAVQSDTSEISVDNFASDDDNGSMKNDFQSEDPVTALSAEPEVADDETESASSEGLAILISSEPITIGDTDPETLLVITGENAENISELDKIGVSIEDGAIRLDSSIWMENEDGTYTQSELGLTLQKAEDARLELVKPEETEAGYLVDDSNSLDEFIGADDRRENDGETTPNNPADTGNLDIEQAMLQIEHQQG